MTAYVTFDEFRTYMDAQTQGRPASYSSASQSFVEGLLQSATEFIETETDRKFAAETKSRFYDRGAISYTHPRRLNLYADLLTVTTLKNFDGSVIPPAGYRLHPRNEPRFTQIEILHDYTWLFTPNGEVEVAGTWGYMAEPSAKVKEITCRLAYLAQNRRFATGEVTVLDGGFQFDTIMPKDVAAWLQSMAQRRPG